VTNGGGGCVMWIGELNDIRDYPDGGQDLFVRLAASELGTFFFLSFNYLMFWCMIVRN
jgi:hypothetical protein